MVILDLFPGGVIQLWDSIANGYWHARRLTFLMGGTFHKLEWLRMVGDMVFLLAGALPITLGAIAQRVEEGSFSHAVKIAPERIPLKICICNACYSGSFMREGRW